MPPCLRYGLALTAKEITMDSCIKMRPVEFFYPVKHIIGHIGYEFYGSNDPTNSVKALKEDRMG